MSTWEERMAACAKARRRARGELSTLYPEDRDELAAQAHAKYVADQPGCESPTPPGPSPFDYCGECCTWAPLSNWSGIYSWRLTCDFKCGHEHHKDEIWLA